MSKLEIKLIPEIVCIAMDAFGDWYGYDADITSPVIGVIEYWDTKHVLQTYSLSNIDFSQYTGKWQDSKHVLIDGEWVCQN